MRKLCIWQVFLQSARPDLNRGPLVPQASQRSRPAKWREVAWLSEIADTAQISLASPRADSEAFGQAPLKVPGRVECYSRRARTERSRPVLVSPSSVGSYWQPRSKLRTCSRSSSLSRSARCRSPACELYVVSVARFARQVLESEERANDKDAGSEIDQAEVPDRGEAPRVMRR